MCDFSEYGIPSEEWLGVEATLPEPKQQNIAELQGTTNLKREATAQRDMELEGLSEQVSMHDYSIPTRDGYDLEGRSYRPSAVCPTQILPVYIHFPGSQSVLSLY